MRLARAMAFSFEIFPRERAIVLRCSGVLTLTDILAPIQRLWADPRYSREYGGIADLRDGSLGIAMCDYRALLNFVRADKNLSVAHWAAVARTPFTTACAMIYRGAVREHHPFAIVPTWSAACEFINVTLPDRLDERLESAGGAPQSALPRDRDDAASQLELSLAGPGENIH